MTAIAEPTAHSGSKVSESNPMTAMLARYDIAARHIGLDAGMNRVLSQPEYEIQVSVPVQMETGKSKCLPAIA